MAANVKTIPAKINAFSQAPLKGIQKRKVAGYARVSTTQDEQLGSYEAQISYYHDYILSRPEWEYVDVYTDEGITGTATKKRDGFNKMVADAKAGKIDLILTKSVSRFARNTVDSLSTIRELKECGTEVYFEKENIWTFDAKGELLITIMSSLAQEESRSISENVKWGMRKKFSDGKFSLCYSKFLGYDKGPDGKLMIVPEQAEIVKRIFGMFLQGRSCNYIARTLTSEGIPSPARGKRWRSETVLSILQNEKYKGDALLQKYFIEDFLTKKQKKNLGEIPQYYVEGDHEAIIEPATFDLVQKMVDDRRIEAGGKQTVHTFSRKIRCPDCGSWYGPKTWHSNSETYRKKVWQCNRKYQNEQKCKSPHLDEEYLKAKFIMATNKFLEQREPKIQLLLELIEKRLTTDELIQTKETLEIEIESLVHQVNQLVASNSRFTQDQEAYNQKYNDLVKKYEEAQQKLVDTIREIAQRRSKKTESRIFLKALEQQSYVEEFADPLFFSFVKEIKPYDISNLGFVFLDDTEIIV